VTDTVTAKGIFLSKFRDLGRVSRCRLKWNQTPFRQDFLLINPVLVNLKKRDHHKGIWQILVKIKKRYLFQEYKGLADDAGHSSLF
jgi:hypothetical protein